MEAPFRGPVRRVEEPPHVPRRPLERRRHGRRRRRHQRRALRRIRQILPEALDRRLQAPLAPEVAWAAQAVQNVSHFPKALHIFGPRFHSVSELICWDE